MRSAIILASLLVASPLVALSPAAEDPAAGARDYRAFGCAACHGTTGAGGGWQGPRVAPEPLPFEAFLGQLREPASKMPRYTAHVLGDRQAADIHAYLRSIPPGRPASSIAMLNR